MQTQASADIVALPQPTHEEKGTLVLVHWVDSRISEGWLHAHELDIVTAKTLGFVLEHDARKIVLTQTVSDDGGVLGMVAIPMVSVIKIEFPHVSRDVSPLGEDEAE